MKRTLYIYLALMLGLLSACSEFLDEVPPVDKYDYEIFGDITRARSFLDPAYRGVRKSPWLDLEYYTDNAINKTKNTSIITAENSPVSSLWYSSIEKQIHINEFFERGLESRYDAYDSIKSENLKERVIGEAYGLRAYYKWVMLKNFAGPSAQDSTMLGFPILDGVLSVDGVDTIARAPYMVCYQSIMNDLDSASHRISFNRYRNDGDADGVKFTSRISGEMIAALRARLALFAASPAYQQIPMAAAADTAYNAIKNIDGAIIGLQPYGNFDNTDNLDHFWRVSYFTSSSWESANFPPSLFGRGECNPSQNLVDAFGDEYGYPIDHLFATYNPLKLYEGREPRFYRFIFHNGVNKFKNANIQVYNGGNDASGVYRKEATRTGYYMKKFLNSTIEFDETSPLYQTRAYKVYPIFTRAGLYLDFAEAAASAYGIEGKSPMMDFSAVDAVAAVRKRTQTSLESDYYLEDEVLQFGTTSDLQALIVKERRIEFCFTGERFYDMRRLKLMDKLEEDIRGIKVVKNDDASFTYSDTVIVRRPHFEKYKIYNPIPREEVLRSNVLIQNKGWE